MRLVVDIMKTEIRFEESEAYIRGAVQKAMHEKLGVKQDGYMFSPAYKAGYWDGIIDFYEKETDTFPTGLLPKVDNILGELQGTLSSKGYTFQYEIIDDRPDKFLAVSDMEPEITANLDDGVYPLRDYQYNSVKSIIENQTGIVNVATNGGKCLTIDTQLLTSNGYRSIEQIFRENNIDPTQSEGLIENNIGLHVVNRYGDLEKPSHLTVNGIKHTNQVVTEQGYAITATDNHPLLTVAPTGEHVWKTTSDLTVGDWLVLRKGDNIFGTDQTVTDRDTAYFIGLAIADGYLGSYHTIGISSDQPELVDFIQSYYSGISTKNVKVFQSGKSKGVTVNLYDSTATKDFHERYKICYGVAKDKSIPECIMQAPQDIQIAFLSGYLESEMSLCSSEKLSFEVTSASKRLLEQTQLLLLNFGIRATLKQKYAKAYPDNYYGRLTCGAVDTLKLLELLHFKTKQRKDQYIKALALSTTRNRNLKSETAPYGKDISQRYVETYTGDRKGLKKAFTVPKSCSMTRLRTLTSQYPDCHASMKELTSQYLNPSYVYCKVSEIKDMGYQPTYDLHMPKTHSFIANGIVNHNTMIASGLIKTILPYLESGERIAFFTHSSAIFSQSADNIEQHLGIKVGRYGAGKKDIQQITFVMIPTINASISADPEAKVKLTPKERLVKRIAKEIAPRFVTGFNQRSFLYNYLKNMRVKTKVDQQLHIMLTDILDTCGTDKQVVMKMKNYQAEYQKILTKKNGKVLQKYKDAMEFLESIAVMIVDEAHHTSSDTWYKTLTACKNAQYRMALTGSIDKSNAVLWQRMQAIFHDIVIKVSNQEMIDRGISAKPKITIFPILAPTDISQKSYMEAYDSGIAKNVYRNTLIAKLAKKQYDREHGVLILVNRLEQGETISEILTQEKVPHYFVSGELDYDTRETEFQNMRSGKLKVMIATTIMDEGVDISGIDTLILGAGGKSLRQTLQRVGRGLRKKKTGENKIEVFDFYDLTNTHLKKHSEERRKIYASEGFEIVDIPIPGSSK